MNIGEFRRGVRPRRGVEGLAIGITRVLGLLVVWREDTNMSRVGTGIRV